MRKNKARDGDEAQGAQDEHNANGPDEAAYEDDRVGKTMLTLRIDTEVVEWFKAGGARYQTRINNALRAHMRARRTGKG